MAPVVEDAELRDWSPFVVMQTEHSLIERTPERGLLPMAQSLDVTPLAWSLLASGLRTGKYSGNESGPGRLDSAPFCALTDRNFAVADAADEK